MVQLAEINRYLQQFAPTALAEKWDNVGLLIGDPHRDVARVLTCLTLTPDVAEEAIAGQVQLIVTHHPVLFKAVQRITAEDPQGRMLLQLIEAGIAVYSPHTGYDSAEEGINVQLARLIGLTDITPLRPSAGEPQYKIIVYVPESGLTVLREALWAAGAGFIGEYSKCSFVMDGTGTFQGSEKSNPTVGQAGRFEEVAEKRLEIDCPRHNLGRALESLRATHPYEEAAFDVIPVETVPVSNTGAGRKGLLPAPIPLSEFVQQVKLKLRLTTVQFVGDPARLVQRVGICCGSGGELLGDARAAGCDVFLTGETRYHTCLDARAQHIALVLVGHHASERPAMEHLAMLLSQQFASLTVWPSRVETDPLQWA